MPSQRLYWVAYILQPAAASTNTGTDKYFSRGKSFTACSPEDQLPEFSLGFHESITLGYASKDPTLIWPDLFIY